MKLAGCGAAPRTIGVRQYKDGGWYTFDDVLSREVPVTVRIGEAEPRTLWAWPEQLEDLAAGHALLDMGLDGRKVLVTAAGERSFVITHHEQPQPAVLPDPGRLDAASLLQCMAGFMGAQGLWDGTGCFHRAGVLDAATRTVLHRTEDIGRHNCIDRLAGWAARNDVQLGGLVMLVSARVTASLCAKAMRAGFRFIVSRSAVTTASVDMASDAGVTLVGFARDRENRFTLFTDAEGRVTE
ncbi:formate dehydrogenase accessory sulfurtransferase FdhD [Oleidesulfovibrio sp.]|uniref:formate dehydrogenase accessory sulfurtransferase FdhD n=1 Tax=Oleidesulfovibrio sp. TaxID=2909707 RepID=UPI003A86E034